MSQLDLFKDQIAKGNFTHFSNCKTLASGNETGLGFDLEKYTEALETLQSEFANRLCDFQKHETVIRLFENPFAALPTNVDSCFQLELIGLQASLKWQDRRDGVVVRASASQSVDLGFIPLVESYQKTLKNGIHSFPAWRSAFREGCGEQAGKFACCVLGQGT